MHLCRSIVLFVVLTVAQTFCLHGATRSHYLVLSGNVNLGAPFASVDFISGPVEKVGKKNCHWWELSVPNEAGPLFRVRVLSANEPFDKQGAGEIERYQLQIPATGEVLEYREINSGKALLPAWDDFQRYFFPHPAIPGVAQTCSYLGQTLALQKTEPDQPWQPWSSVKILNLNREMLVGTSRPFKDTEGHRLPDKKEYTYTNFVAEDYRTMIDAGINLYTIEPYQEQWVRSEPVFYLRAAKGTPALQYPADLYRANYLGEMMFVDEPAIQTIYGVEPRKLAQSLTDVSGLIEQRTRTGYFSPAYYGIWHVEEELREQHVNFGDMRLAQTDYPVWETLIEAGYYEVKAGGNGLVHEGRYQLTKFDESVEKITGVKYKHNTAEVLQFYNALLRGAVRPFGKFWGTAIYGQCDPAIAPLAFDKAYDMGARYFWFWSSDHDHHLPWPEQLALARSLKEYAAQHPRRSIYLPAPKRDTVITIPNGYQLAFEDMSWIKALSDPKGKATGQYKNVLKRAFAAIQHCSARGEDYDITVDDGHRIEGYRRVIRIKEQ